MLPQKRRLQRPFFKEILEKGKSHHFPLFSIRVYFPPIQDENKFSVIVSKKIAKQAVERNKIRRQIYSILKDIESSQTLYCAIWPKIGVKRKKYSELDETLKINISSLI